MPVRPAPLGERTREPSAGLRRRGLTPQPLPEAATWDNRSDTAREIDAAVERTRAWAPALEGVARRLAGDDTGAERAYDRALARQARADELDSDVDPNVLNAESVGEALAGVRKLAIGSAPSLVAGVGAGAVGRGLARRTAMNAERQGLAHEAAEALSGTGVQSPTARAAGGRVAAAQQQEAVQNMASRAARRDPAAMRRVDRAGNIGMMAGGTAGTLPTMVAESAEHLAEADRGQTTAVLGHNVAAAAVGFLPYERLMGRAFANPRAQRAVDQSVRQQLRKAGVDVAKQGGIQALVEGGSEAAQALIQRAGHRYVDQNIELFSREAFDEYFANAVGGAILGGIMGSGMEAALQGGQAAGAGARWTRARADEARTVIRQRLADAADRVRERERARRQGTPAGAEPAPPGDASTLYRRAQDAVADVAVQATGAARRFREAFRRQQEDADLGERADGVLELLDDMLEPRPDSGPMGPLFAKAGTTTQQLMLRQLNPEFIARSREEDVLRLGRIMEKAATGKELARPELNTLQIVLDNPESGVTRQRLERLADLGIIGGLIDIKGQARRLSRDVGPETYARQELDPNAQARQAMQEDDGEVTGDVRTDPEGAEDVFAMPETSAAQERLAPIDRMNSIRAELRRMRQEMGDAEARADARYNELRQEGARLQNQVREGLRRNNGIVTRNDSNARSKAFWRRTGRSAAYVDLVQPARIELNNGRVLEQPERLDLGMLIMRQQAAIRAEGTKSEDVPPLTALLRGLSEAVQVGIEVNPDSFKVGDIVNSRTGALIMRITPRIRNQLRGAVEAGGGEISPRTGSGPLMREAIRTDPEIAATARRELAKLEALESPTDSQQRRLEFLAAALEGVRAEQEMSAVVDGEQTANINPVDHGEPVNDGRKRVARVVPPGTRTEGGIDAGRFVPDTSPVAAVSFDTRHDETLAAYRRATKAAKTPRERAAARRRAGEDIGRKELDHELEAGTISEARYKAEIQRLGDAGSGLARRYLVRALRGDLPGAVRVTHASADTEAPATGRDRDRELPGRDEPGSARQVAERLERQRRREEGEADGAPRPKRRVVKKGADRADAQRRAEQLKKSVAAEKAKAQVALGESARAKRGEHDHQRESAFAMSVLRAMGYTTDQIPLLRVTSRVREGDWGLFSARRGEIGLADGLTGRARVEVLSHEIGHAIVAAEISRATGVPAADLINEDGTGVRGEQWMGALAKANPELYAELRVDYDAFRARHGDLSSITDMRMDRSGPAQAAAVRRFLREHDMTEMPVGMSSRAEYHLSMNEWLADHIGRALVQSKQGQSRLERFFGDIARQLRRVYDMLFKGAQADRWRPAPSVEKWVEGMFDRNVAAVRAATGKPVSVAGGKAAVEAATVDALRSQPGREPPSRPPPPDDPDGGGPPSNLPDKQAGFTQTMRYIRETMPPQEQKLVLRMLDTAAARKALNRYYADFPRIQRAFDSAAHGDEARIAGAFILWREGYLVGGRQSGSVFQTLADELQKTAVGGGRTTRSVGDDLAKLFGLADTDNYVERIFNDLATGRINRLKERGGYDVRKIEARERGARQERWNRLVSHYESVNDAIGRVFDGKGQRLRQSGVAALRRLAATLQKPQGTTGEDPGYIPAVRNTHARYSTRLRKIHNGLKPRESVRAFTLLQRGATDLSSEPAPVAQAVKDTRRVLDDLYDYMKDAGVKVGKRENFFPVMMDVRRPQDQEKLRTLLSDPFYEAPIREFFSRVGEDGNRTPSDTPIEDLIDNLVKGAAPATEYTPAFAPDSPKFRSQNYRSMQFIYDAAERARKNNDAALLARMEKNVATFASLQSKDPAALLTRYVEPAIKRAEYARRFGDDGSRLEKLLEQAKAQGATPAQIIEARDTVKAAIGTYGADGSPTLAALSPELSKKFSGPRVRGFIRNVQAYQNIRLLPLATLTSMVDPMGIAVRSGGELGMAWDGYKTGIRGLFDKATRAEQEAALEILGAADDMFAEVAIHQPTDTDVSNVSTANRVNNWLFRVNLLQGWTKATRFMGLEAAHQFILKHNAGANELSSLYMRELGLRPGDVRSVYGISSYARNGEARMVPKVEVLTEVEREALRDAAKGGDAHAKAELARDERVRNALMQFVDEAILRPNPMQTPMWMSDPYMGLVSQYKAFAYALYDQIYRRSSIEADRGNTRAFGAMLLYVPAMLGAEVLRELIQNLGRDERRRDWGVLEYTALAAERTGLYSPRFDAARTAYEDAQRRQVPLTSHTGPTAGQARDIYRAFTGRRSLAEEAQRAAPGAAVHRRWDENVAQMASSRRARREEEPDVRQMALDAAGQ